MIHPGVYNVAGQQSYYTFDATRLQNVNANQTGCVLTNTVTADTAIFEATLQNEVCNGPGGCIFRGVTLHSRSVVVRIWCPEQSFVQWTRLPSSTCSILRDSFGYCRCPL